MVSVPRLGRNDVLQSSPEAPHLLLMAADNLVANAIGPDDNSPHLLPVSNAEREGFYRPRRRGRVLTRPGISTRSQTNKSGSRKNDVPPENVVESAWNLYFEVM